MQRVRSDQSWMSLLTYPLPAIAGRTLIQRNLIQPKLERGYLAFDKCTLLSSQGSDAPAARSLDLAGRATSLSYPLRLSQVKSTDPDLERSAGRLRPLLRRGNPILDPEVRDSQGESRWVVVLRLRGRGLRPSALSLWGEQVLLYVTAGRVPNPARIPGVSRRRAAEFRPFGHARAGGDRPADHDRQCRPWRRRPRARRFRPCPLSPPRPRTCSIASAATWARAARR